MGANDVTLRWGVCLPLSYWIDLESDHSSASTVLWSTAPHPVAIKKISITIQYVKLLKSWGES